MNPNQHQILTSGLFGQKGELYIRYLVGILPDKIKGIPEGLYRGLLFRERERKQEG